MRAAMGAGVGGSGAAGAGLRMGGNGHDDARPEDDERSLGSGGEPDLTFQGFDPKLFKAEGEAIPLLRPVSQLWASLTRNLGPHEFRPKRAMRISVIAPFFRRDADFFRQWQLPKGNESRAQATAALVSLLFAGTAMGLTSGKHEENTRNQQSNAQHEDETGGAGAKPKAPKPLTRVSRYTFIPTGDEQDSHPMFQIGLEEIYNRRQTEVVALAVWLFVNDEMHSTSSLVAKVIGDTRALHDGARASAQLASQRDKAVGAETARHDKSGCGFADLTNNFEKNAGLQYKLIKGRDDLLRMLDLHSGRTSSQDGRPCVPDMAAHLNCAAGRRVFQGDSRTGCGGRHPLAPEFLFNGKTAAGLAFGLVGLDGENLDVCAEQLDPSQYWDADGYFRTPALERDCFWLCTSYEARTPFDLPLTRPLQGTVLPGNALMELFVEEQRRQAAQADGDEEEEEAAVDGNADGHAAYDQSVYNRLRSVMTQRDQYQRDMDALLSNSNCSYDQMMAGGLDVVGHNANPDESKGEANYTLRTVSMTERVTKETDRLWTRVVQPWQTRVEAELNAMQARIEKADRKAAQARRDAERAEEAEMRAAGVGEPETDPDEMEVDDADVSEADEGDTWAAYDERRAAFQTRLHRVKRDVVQYHARLLKSCFLSTKDAATLPAGYKAMHAGLEQGVKERGGTASMAFHGKGHALRHYDRMVYGALQEWLRQLFVDDCRVQGRDRRIMDEMYLTSFEMFHKNTFILVIASAKGCGKSVRAVRLMTILPVGWSTKNSGTTARSHANGNNSPANGTVVVCDEMISDLTPAECTEKMEAIKTIVGEREIEIERTRSVKTQDGTEQHVTYRIVTDHKQVYVVVSR